MNTIRFNYLPFISFSSLTFYLVSLDIFTTIRAHYHIIFFQLVWNISSFYKYMPILCRLIICWYFYCFSNIFLLSFTSAGFPSLPRHIYAIESTISRLLYRHFFNYWYFSFFIIFIDTQVIIVFFSYSFHIYFHILLLSITRALLTRPLSKAQLYISRATLQFLSYLLSLVFITLMTWDFWLHTSPLRFDYFVIRHYFIFSFPHFGLITKFDIFLISFY